MYIDTTYYSVLSDNDYKSKNNNEYRILNTDEGIGGRFKHSDKLKILNYK